MTDAEKPSKKITDDSIYTPQKVVGDLDMSRAQGQRVLRRLLDAADFIKANPSRFETTAEWLMGETGIDWQTMLSLKSVEEELQCFMFISLVDQAMEYRLDFIAVDEEITDNEIEPLMSVVLQLGMINIYFEEEV